jgi:hypothetical protein
LISIKGYLVVPTKVYKFKKVPLPDSGVPGPVIVTVSLIVNKGGSEAIESVITNGPPRSPEDITESIPGVVIRYAF